MVSMQYENVIFPGRVGFHCKNCGVCCRDQPPDISFKEQKKIETVGYRNFMQNPSNPNNRCIRRNKDGGCFFYDKENSCKINSIKPSICILEPFIITDFDYESNKIFLGLNPLAIKNCRGIFYGENIVLKEIGEAAQEIIAEFSEIVARKTGLLVTDKKVGILTQRLVRRTRTGCS